MILGLLAKPKSSRPDPTVLRREYDLFHADRRAIEFDENGWRLFWYEGEDVRPWSCLRQVYDLDTLLLLGTGTTCAREAQTLHDHQIVAKTGEKRTKTGPFQKTEIFPILQLGKGSRIFYELAKWPFRLSQPRIQPLCHFSATGAGKKCPGAKHIPKTGAKSCPPPGSDRIIHGCWNAT
jgi:hypothetical protein